MNYNSDDINDLIKFFDSRYDDRYVMQRKCNDIQQSINKKLSNDDKRIDLLSQRFSVWNKLLWTIASASVGALITSIVQLVMLK